jgi:cell division protein FtsL
MTVDIRKRTSGIRQQMGANTVTTSKATIYWIVIMSLFIGELFFNTWCRVQSTKRGYEITRLRAETDQLSLVQKSLQIELARLKSPDRLSRIAKDKLGLITPSTQQVIEIE